MCKINWRKPPEPADNELLLYVSCEEDGITPKNIEVKSNPCIRKSNTSEGKNRLAIFWRLADWKKQYESTEKKTKSRRTRGQDFTIGLYFYADGRPIEMRSDTGDSELALKFVSATMAMLVDEKSSIQFSSLLSTVES